MDHLTATYYPYRFYFILPAGTSRGVMTFRDSYFIRLSYVSYPEVYGTGECCLLPGLSPDLNPGLEPLLQKVCKGINSGLFPNPDSLSGYPGVKMALETAWIDLQNGGRGILFPSPFTKGEITLPINGLIWMGNVDSMKRQIDRKISEGFRVLKMKIGAIGFEEEVEVIRYIRTRYSELPISLRLDANGAFQSADAYDRLSRLAEYHIHSVEQPLTPGNPDAMADLCCKSPIPIALDEELIGIERCEEKRELLERILPQYIILKPTLLGGFQAAEEWIRLADALNIGWWVTSALESNIGLNALAQWTALLPGTKVHGLGTGTLFRNNFTSPLILKGDSIGYQPDKGWDISL